jgi:hypothetical protein
MIAAAQLRSCGKLAPTRPPSTFPQPPQLRRRANVLTMSLDDSVSYLPGTYGAGVRSSDHRRATHVWAGAA